MICMRAWMSSKFGGIRPRTTELAALERIKKSQNYNGETMSSTIFDWILLIFAGNEDMHKSLNELKFCQM